MCCLRPELRVACSTLRAVGNSSFAIGTEAYTAAQQWDRKLAEQFRSVVSKQKILQFLVLAAPV
jgi:hypothetical protein